MNDKKIGCVQHDCQECKARAAIERQSVPAGYVLVPIEPTDEMLGAFFNACPMLGGGDDWEAATEGARKEVAREWAAPWAAMLAAAPQPCIACGDIGGHDKACARVRWGIDSAPQPQPVQPTPTIKDYLIVQSTVPLPADFLQFWQAINPKAMTRRVLALTAWNLSKHEAKKQFKTMTISKTFDNSNAENLTILDLSDKVFLRDLSTQAKEMAESPGCAPAWAATYMALEASASMLADLIENTEVRDA